MSVNFNAGSATAWNKSTLVFGGNEGAVKFPTNIQIPEPHYSRLLLRDFMIAYHPVYPGDDGSPLKKDIDETDRLELAYGQNTFSLDVAPLIMIILLTFFIHGKLMVIIRNGVVQVRITGFLSEICLLAVIRYKFVPYPMKRSIRLMRQGTFRLL